MGARIQELWPKVKYWAEGAAGEWGTPIIVILVAFASFGLGRLSAGEAVKPVVTVGEAEMAAAAAPALAPGGLIVASRTGSAYHFPWCAGGQSIKEGNKVWFKDETAARKAGYSPAKNCKGLK